MGYNQALKLQEAKGHRSRLRERLLKSGPEGCADYELLEMMLFLAQPRGDTKPLAKKLLLRFGSIGGVLHGEELALREISGVGDTTLAVFKIFSGVINAVQKEKARAKPVLGTSQEVLDYLQGAMGNLPTEELRLMFLDRKNQIIADEVQQRGTLDQTPIYPREVVRRALELGASALILVHNHPSGDPTPSHGDIEMTQRVVDAAKTLGIEVHDHLIIGKGEYTSFRERGLL